MPGPNNEPNHDIELPPQNLNAERYVLGAMIIDESVIGQVAAETAADEFYNDHHAMIFSVIVDMKTGGKPVDLLALAGELERIGKLADVGGWPYLHELMEVCQFSDYAPQHAKTIRDVWKRRKLERILLNLASSARDMTSDPSKIIELIKTIDEISFDRSSALNRAVIRSMAEVQPTILEWLWPGRIALGKMTLLVGDPGLGKSFLTVDIAARTTRGERWPDDQETYHPVGSVMMFNSEDDIADTIRPRLDAAGADPTKVFFVENIVCVDGKTGKQKRRAFSLELDLPYLEEWLKSTPDARLIVIDPISAYCGSTDSHKNAEVRAMLSPLAELAGRYGIAIVCVTHLSKGSGGKMVYRATGSIAFAAAARAVWSVNRDLDDPERRLMLPAKMNLCRESNGLAYQIVQGRIRWEESPIEMTADDYLGKESNRSTENPDIATARRDASQWLMETLKSGERPTKEVIADGKELGHSEKTLRRAFKDLGGKAQKSGFNGGWCWSLNSEDGHQHGQNPCDTNRGHLGHLRESWPSSKMATSSQDGHPSQEDGHPPLEDGQHTNNNKTLLNNEDGHVYAEDGQPFCVGATDVDFDDVRNLFGGPA